MGWEEEATGGARSGCVYRPPATDGGVMMYVVAARGVVVVADFWRQHGIQSPNVNNGQASCNKLN